MVPRPIKRRFHSSPSGTGPISGVFLAGSVLMYILVVATRSGLPEDWMGLARHVVSAVLGAWSVTSCHPSEGAQANA